MAEHGHTWSDREIALLLQVWSERSIQAQLLGAVQKEVPYWKIVEKLRKAGFDRTYKQCRDKVKALKKCYKDVVDRLWRSGAGVEFDEEITVSDFPWFTAIHNVMRDRAVTNPRNVIDSATPGPSRVETEAGDESEEDYDAGMMTPEPTPTRSRTPTTANSRSDTPTDRAASPTDRTLPTDMTDTPASRTTTPVNKTTTPADRTTAPPKKKRKKVSKTDKAEGATNELVEKVLQQQAEERKKADELERERMK